MNFGENRKKSDVHIVSKVMVVVLQTRQTLVVCSLPQLFMQNTDHFVVFVVRQTCLLWSDTVNDESGDDEVTGEGLSLCRCIRLLDSGEVIST